VTVLLFEPRKESILCPIYEPPSSTFLLGTKNGGRFKFPRKGFLHQYPSPVEDFSMTVRAVPAGMAFPSITTRLSSLTCFTFRGGVFTYLPRWRDKNPHRYSPPSCLRSKQALQTDIGSISQKLPAISYSDQLHDLRRFTVAVIPHLSSLDRISRPPRKLLPFDNGTACSGGLRGTWGGQTG